MPAAFVNHIGNRWSQEGYQKKGGNCQFPFHVPSCLLGQQNNEQNSAFDAPRIDADQSASTATALLINPQCPLQGSKADPKPRAISVRSSQASVRHVRKVPTAEEHHSHCDASQRGIYWRPPQLLREVDMSQGQSIRDASHLYEVERRVQHAARPGFRIMELQLSPTQKVPWHSHTNITDTFYVLEGHMRLFLQDPKEEVNLKPGEIHVVGAARPHLVTNGGTKSLTFLVLQGIGEYDYVPLTSS